jgi:hypothetical protein
MVVEGQLASINEGNQAERVVIGLGAGASDVEARVQLYTTNPSGLEVVETFTTSMKSGYMPGMAETMGAGAIGGHLAVAAVAGTGLHAISEKLSGDVDAEAKRTAKAIGKQLGATSRSGLGAGGEVGGTARCEPRLLGALEPSSQTSCASRPSDSAAPRRSAHVQEQRATWSRAAFSGEQIGQCRAAAELARRVARALRLEPQDPRCSVISGSARDPPQLELDDGLEGRDLELVLPEQLVAPRAHALPGLCQRNSPPPTSAPRMLRCWRGPRRCRDPGRSAR